MVVRVLCSQHVLSDISAICDFVVVLANSHVLLADDIEFVMESHRFLTMSRDDNLVLPIGATALDEHWTSRETTILARIALPLIDQKWNVERPTLEEIVMAYLRIGAPPRLDTTPEWDDPNEEGIS